MAVVDPDEWWHSLPPDRRHQIWRWITQNGTSSGESSHPATPGQRELFALRPDQP